MTYPHFQSTAAPDASTPQHKIDAERRRRAFAAIERCLRIAVAGIACEPDDEGGKT